MIWKMIKKGGNLLRDMLRFFHRGWQARLLVSYARSFVSSLLLHLNQFRHSLYSGGMELHTIKDHQITKLKSTTRGLHSLLPPDARFTFSILMIVDKPDHNFFKISLESALEQSAPHVEILLGCVQPMSDEIRDVIAHFETEYRSALNVYPLNDQDTHADLAKRAKGHFHLLLGQEDWIRPDLLFRYEQTLRILQDSENTVLYCRSNQLRGRNAFIPECIRKPCARLTFPYFFDRVETAGLLVPSTLWRKIEKYSLGVDVEERELLLRLDLAGAKFQPVPFCLYSVRRGSDEKAPMSLSVLEKYTIAKGLTWQWHPGYNGKPRAIPTLPNRPHIQVIIPFNDQKEITLKCIHSILKQKNISTKITAIDNRSVDRTITREIRDLGGEVIVIDEPFNYSRLNNLAVQQTKTASDCEILLFLNNDVELESNALEEMLRWIDQPLIGIVGCRLHFPDGKLQHGGVRLLPHETMMRWEHREKFRHFEDLDASKSLGIVDAVTAACAMIKRQTFLDVGGLDEIWYPIGYSDTNLAMKLAARGLKCFYTPYAVGTHHESISRKTAIEDYENSWWLHHLWMDRFKDHA